MTEFLSPYQTAKVLEGVIPANQLVRPNWLQTFFSTVTNRETETVNFDKEFQTKNTPACYVLPEVDAPVVRLQGFGTTEMRFAYVKEGFASADYSEISSRQLGQPFGQVDVWENWLNDARKKAAITEQNIETLFELNAANLLVYGKHTASSPYHPTIVYDFQRTVITTEAALLAGYDASNNVGVPEVDLTTLVANGGAGKRAWGSTGGTVIPTPYKDLVCIVTTIRRRGECNAVVMANNAYAELEKDINTNYKDAATTTLEVMSRISLNVTPVVTKYSDVQFRRSLPLGDGTFVDIYTYNAVYNDRTTAAVTKFIPDGYVVGLPAPSKGIKVYGRVFHPRAQFAAMPRFINVWEDAKSGKMKSEIHCNYLMGHTDINTVVSWKVM